MSRPSKNQCTDPALYVNVTRVCVSRPRDDSYVLRPRDDRRFMSEGRHKQKGPKIESTQSLSSALPPNGNLGERKNV